MLDKDKIKRNFSRSAAEYDKHALLQKDMADRTFSSVESLKPARILDVGCGTGYLGRKISERFPAAEVFGVDIAPGMIDAAESGKNPKNVVFKVADGENLPFDDGSFDLVVSNASLQWMDAEKAIAEAARVLTPDGRFFFSTFGPATLCELREAGLSVNDFPEMVWLENVLTNYFDGVELIKEIKQKRYRDIFELFFYLKGIGAQTPVKVRSKGLITRKKINRLLPEGIEVSYEIFYGNASS